MKFLVRCEVDKIKFYGLKKGSRPMITIGGRLYRCDDGRMIEDKSSAQAIIIYGLDGIQPYSSVGEKMDPDMTKAYIDSAKLGGTKKKVWAELGTMGDSMMKLFGAIVVGGALLWYVVGQVL